MNTISKLLLIVFFCCLQSCTKPSIDVSSKIYANRDIKLKAKGGDLRLKNADIKLGRDFYATGHSIEVEEIRAPRDIIMEVE